MTTEHDGKARASAHTAVVRLDPVSIVLVERRGCTRWSAGPAYDSKSGSETLNIAISSVGRLGQTNP